MEGLDQLFDRFSTTELDLVGGRDSLSALLFNAPEAIRKVMLSSIGELRKVVVKDADTNTNCLSVLQVNLANFIRTMYQSKASFVSQNSVQMYDAYQKWLREKLEGGTLEVNVEECLEQGLTIVNENMPIFENKEQGKRRSQTLCLFMSTLGASIEGEPSNASVKEAKIWADVALAGRQGVAESRASISAMVDSGLAKFGTLLMIMASVATVTAVGISAYCLALMFRSGANMARGAIGRVWAYAGKYKKEENQKQTQNQKQKQKQSWLAWLAKRMGRKEERLALPTSKDEERAKRDIDSAVREFGPMTEAQNRASRGLPPVSRRTNTCPQVRRPFASGQCGSGKEPRINKHGDECCYRLGTHAESIPTPNPNRKNTCPKKRRPNAKGKCPADSERRLNKHGDACCFKI
jgi:hypothetical protein